MKSFKSKLKAFTLFLLLLLCSVYYIPSARSNYPTPTNLKYINDYTNTINNDYKEKIVSIGKELEDKTGAQAIIVVINSTNNIPIEDYTNKLFRGWGIGKSDKNNGLLILLAINDRQYRVEVGRGLEGAIPDALSNRVMESLAKPSFAQRNYGGGLLNSYSKLCDYIAEEYGVTLDKSLNIELPSQTQSTTSTNKNLGFVGIGFLILIFLYTNTINNDYKEKIVSIGKELEDKTGAQAIIVVINSTNNIPIEDYTNKLFRGWGIGKSDKNNGLLILLAINDRQYRVEVGRGLEGAIPDALSNRVMESLAKPSFAQRNYGGGLLNSYSKLCDYIAEEYGVTLDKSLNIELPSQTQSTTSTNKNLGFVGIGFLILIFLDLFFNRGRIMSTLLQLLFWNNFFNGGRRGGGGFGGGSSGGFGGFGGGSSNGGGSSGNW